jgi:hypothetical protein
MGCKIAMFSYEGANIIEAPVEMLWLQGADKDIDKGNMFMYGVDDYGVIYELYEGELNSNDNEETKLNKMRNYVNKLNGQLQDLKATLARTTKKNEQEVLEKEIKKLRSKIKEVYKNSIVGSLITGIRMLNNSTAAQYPINMDEPQELKNIGIENQSYNANMIQSAYSPIGASVQKWVNSVGKDVIGIAATGLKAFSAMYYYHITNKDFANKPFVFMGESYYVASIPEEDMDKFNATITAFEKADSNEKALRILEGFKSDGIQSAMLSAATDFCTFI